MNDLSKALADAMETAIHLVDELTDAHRSALRIGNVPPQGLSRGDKATAALLSRLKGEALQIMNTLSAIQ